MGALLGPRGGLEELPCATSLSSAPVSGIIRSETAAIDGTTTVDIAPTLPLCTWDVGVGAVHPDHAGVLQQLTAWQVADARPWAFYSEAAQVENMLDPAASMMDPARWSKSIPGGPTLLPNPEGSERFLRTISTPADGTWVHLSDVPVPHEVTLTVSVVLSSYTGMTGYFYVDELAMDGRTIRVHEATTPGVLERVSHTFETTAQTVAISFRLSVCATVAGAQLTLTDRHVGRWAPGLGAMNTILAQVSRSELMAVITPNDWGRRSAQQWQVREIGRATLPHAG
jgi:hypothetical protein